jgi:hypothetical protein
MTLFGTTLDGQQLIGLVSLLTVLAFWIVVLRREQGYARWFRQWESDRKARRDAELRVEGHGPETSDRADHKRGPWG